MPLNQNTLQTIACAKGSFLISLEGIEGAGKTTQINLIKEYFQKQGKSVEVFREPGATDLGEKLRSVILSQKKTLNPLTEALIFAAARVELLDQKVRPLLGQENTIVVLDRYLDSSFAYQGVARGLGIEKVIQIHSTNELNCLPHLTFYLDISVETSMQRQQKRGNEKDYFESQKNSFHHKLKEGFDQVHSLWPDRVKKIDASLSEEKVFSQIKKYIQEDLK